MTVPSPPDVSISAFLVPGSSVPDPAVPGPSVSGFLSLVSLPDVNLPPAVLAVAIGLLLVTSVLAGARVVRDGSLVDRVLGFDLLLLTIVGLVAVDALWRGVDTFVGVLLVIAILGFLGTVAIAHFIDRRGGHR